jgi:competence protein ComEA
MNKRRIFILAVVALAAAAAILRAHPSAPAERAAVAFPEPMMGHTPSPTQLVVYVAGAVARSGVYRLPAGARAESAIRAAGGTTAQADTVAVNLAEPLRDGEEVVVPLRGAAPEGSRDVYGAGTRGRFRAQCSSSPHRRSGRPGSRFSGRHARRNRSTAEANVSVDLNRADAAELETLPGIGPHLAERIVAFRERNGPFASLDELGDVNGVSPRLLDEIAPYVSVTR